MVLVKRERHDGRRAAFTLLEVLIVVAILVILAGVGGVTMLKYLDDARKDKARIDVKTLSDVVKTYEVKHDGPPANLQALTQPDTDGSKPYLESAEALRDPWGGEYQFDPGTGRVWTTAKDGTVISSK